MQPIASLDAVADRFGALVFDQWGVLHDGTSPYGAAPAVLAGLRARGVRLAVLSNSGKRAGSNADRLAAFGYGADLFDCVMTSGEAFWQDVAAGRVPHTRFAAIVARPGDAEAWASGLDIDLADDPAAADAVLLMGLPEGSDGAAARAVLATAASRGLTVYCTNPDKASPRADGVLQTAPGALAHDYAQGGGTVIYYGKPHPPVFAALQRALDLPADRILMIGDSLEHDIAGADRAGWRSVLVQGGLYRAAFEQGARVADLAARMNAPAPDYMIFEVA